MDAAIDGVHVADTPSGQVPVVLVGVAETTDVLPIFVGFEEALAIRRGLDAEDTPRPFTHDLLLDAVEELGGRVDAVEITGLEDGTYIAELRLATPRGSVTLDARPSDSLALAARTGAPITVADAVFDAGKRGTDAFTDLRDIREVTE
ncbi:bifunctional nuclease family protein [Halosegnis longus]|uniref:bifunctional nuclease family protein n=1 Tax=Halosegnis longus TaxID=2216012 RepID=UPI00096A48B9|nr:MULTISPECIES: bifunctional nuclease family protein [Halobacteriales]